MRFQFCTDSGSDRLPHSAIKSDAHSTLFGFSRAKNNWVKITLDRVKNIRFHDYLILTFVVTFMMAVLGTA